MQDPLEVEHLGVFFAAKEKIIEEPCESLRRMTTPMAQHSSASWI